MVENAPEIPVHPVQGDRIITEMPQVVTLRAYEVYCRVFGPQPAMIEGECRGGFGVGELLALLYARSFPQSEWSKRVDEALAGMKQGYRRG